MPSLPPTSPAPRPAAAAANGVTHTVYLSLGSNLGDRADNLKRAISALPNAGVAVKRVSPFYETEPVDFLQQPKFVNSALQAETELAPLDLLHALQRIEIEIGRLKSVSKGPRLIDIDILLYGSETIDIPRLCVPHPRMHLRRFVLVPLNDIAPKVPHPRLNLSIADLLADLSDTSKVQLLSSDK